MKNTNDDFVDRLRSESDIVSVVSDYVPLKKKGKNYWGCCPFHHEKTPSFSVAPDKGFFYCFGCGAGGNVFNFLMKIENIDFFSAVKLLAKKLNISLPEKEKTTEEKNHDRKYERLCHVNQLAADFFHSCLTKTTYGKDALAYLVQRGITSAVIDEFQLGFAPPLWDKLSQSFTSRGIATETLIDSGLSAARTSGGVYDRFRNRIIFPIANLRGQVVGFGGRVLDDSQPKYLNSPETLLYNKRRELYGLHKAFKSIREQERTIVVEGYLDQISVYGAGITNVVASLGTAFTVEQAKMLLKLAPEILFAYDSDAAGQKATLRALATVSELGAKVKIIQIPDGKDPDEFIRKHGASAFQLLVDNALSFIEYQIERALTEGDYSHLEGKVAVINQVIPSLALSENVVEENAYIAHLSAVLTIDEGSIREELKKYRFVAKKDKNVKLGYTTSAFSLAKKPIVAAEQAERQLIYFLFQDNSIIPYVQSLLRVEHFQNSFRQEIMNQLLIAYNMGKVIEPAQCSLSVSTEAATELSHIMLLDNPCEDKVKMVDDYIRTIQLAYLRNQYEEHRLKADELERMGDSRFLQELAESQRIKHEISKLHSLE
ncbi:DNA primase [Sporomusaceae bacterium BoRhaA]|uniref:DNA primase n=1 Tax=Pelorhabdus rhamnosifermentans TaxID=2772457 RepID=UPI001C05EE7E|nr:DNA primase [Pelorhabdus rhamnosifermentans]MBU2701518.1 DNA primase [Pelorhabdus rhamnosifermentans]